MTTSPSSKPRPLSPHLGIYKRQMSSVLSILHRLSGIALALGLPIFVAWLVMLAAGLNAYAFFTDNLANVLGQLVLFGGFFLTLWYGLNVAEANEKRSSAFLKGFLVFLNFAAAVAITLIANYFIIAKFPEQSNTVFGYAGQAVLFGLTWSFFYHFCCGIRHLLWDAGWFLTIRGMRVTGWITFLVSTAVTLGLWIKILELWPEIMNVWSKITKVFT